MIVGCVKEIKTQEYRVGLIPSHVTSFIEAGHTVLIEKGAGIGSGFSDELYQSYGAQLRERADEVWKQSDMIIKVKEPLPAEYGYFRKGLILFTYLHLAADETLTRRLLKDEVTALAYETLEVNHELPLLKPMSEIAGRLSVQEAAKVLEKPMGGKGLLLAGVPGVKRAKVLIIGAGSAGSNAARIAVGMGADVTILDRKIEKLERMEQLFGSSISTLYSTPATLRELLPDADVIIGAVLVPGAKAPNLLRREDLSRMQAGSVLVDIAVDQGGCFETTRATTHSDPTYVVDGIVHYCVANMPGAVPMTSTLALSNATLEYALRFATQGVHEAIKTQPFLKSALNCYAGKCTNAPVAEAFDLVYEADVW
jgi:alanine dehydrogenase